MKLIEKIEIKHFRSFLGTPKKFETTVVDLRDLNIFSGSNDSGKSNILRALNVFFNGEISHGIPFEFNRDFFIGKKDSGHKVIEISINFNLSNDEKRDKFLPERFRISKYYDRNGFRNHIYSFNLKEKIEEIKVDSRSENNEHLKSIFLQGNPNPTEGERKAAGRREWNYRVKFSGFLNKSVSFEYVPAIRDKNFFSQLIGRVITRVKNNEDNEVLRLQKEKNKIDNWQKTIANKSEKKDFKENLTSESWRTKRKQEIDESTKKESKLAATITNLEEEINNYSKSLIGSISFLDSEFKIGKNLQDFFEGFDVGTGAGKAIPLNLRGDGIQAKFVPKILNFLSEIDTEKKYFLWGFEEPENSAEYKNQQYLAEDFKEISAKDKQIFITTHSEEFLQLYDGSEINKEDRISNLYHVKKLLNDEWGEYSQIFLFDVDKNEFEFANQRSLLEEDLGHSYIRAKHSKELIERERSFLLEKENILQENAELQDLIKQNNKPLVFVEDTYDELYKIAWLKLNDHSHTKDNFKSIFDNRCSFSIYKAEGATPLAGFMRAKNIEYLNNKKIIGLFDFDQEGVKQFISLKNESYWNGDHLGNKGEGISKERKDHDCFCALLIPIPQSLNTLADLEFPSFVEIENLLPVKFLKDNSFVDMKFATGATEYLEIKNDKKPRVWRKTLELAKDDFKNFKPLFEKINKLFE
jgi:AAA ATPase-like protein